MPLLRCKFRYFIHKKKLQDGSWDLMEGIQTEQSIHVHLEVSLKSLSHITTQESEVYYKLKDMFVT